MKLKFFICFIAMFTMLSIASAQKNITSQEYTTALGVKFYPGAFSVKHFFKPSTAIDGLGYFWNKGMRITGLYEFHMDIANAEGLKWYVGPGAHVGFYNNKYYKGGTSVGVDGVIGLDYKFKNAPINVSLDWQPSVEFSDYDGFSGSWGGLGIRYVF